MSKSPIKSQFHKPTAVVKREQTVVYQGPLPLPDQIAGYESALPGSAERIISMAEKEQNARIERENQKLEIEKERVSVSKFQIKAAVFCVVLYLAAAIALAILGFEVAVGIMLGGTAIASIIGYIMKSTNKKENNE